ncbi:PaaI family thioesterase [Desulfocurvus sp. DL9XJH121]
MGIDIEEYTDIIENRLPFHAFLGIKVRHLGEGACRLAIPFRPEFIGHVGWGALHGGVISTLVDVAGGAALQTLFGLDAKLATIDLRVDYLKPALGCGLEAEARVRLSGNRVGNSHVTVYAEGDPATVLAEGRGVYNIRLAGGRG